MKEFAPESQEFLGEDISGVEDIDSEMDLISDGPELDDLEVPVDPETGVSLGRATLADVKIDRERVEEEEQ